MHFYSWPTALAKRFSLLTAAILLAAGIATAQDVEDQLEYNFLGAGARANGMGDAFVAVADDATAIFWNPAGLFLLDRPETSFGFQFASEKVEQDRRTQMLLFGVYAEICGRMLTEKECNSLCGKGIQHFIRC